MPELKLKFGIKFDKMPKDSWSIGACFTHAFGEETYLYINLLFVSVSIGKLYDYDDDDYDLDNFEEFDKI